MALGFPSNVGVDSAARTTSGPAPHELCSIDVEPFPSKAASDPAPSLDTSVGEVEITADTVADGGVNVVVAGGGAFGGFVGIAVTVGGVRVAD